MEIKNNVDSARKFVLEVEKEIANLTTEQIGNIREGLKNKMQS
jgi:hypothetical protein